MLAEYVVVSNHLVSEGMFNVKGLISAKLPDVIVRYGDD